MNVAEYKTRIIDLINDEVIIDSGTGDLAGSTISASILLSSIHAALDAVSSRLWKSATYDVVPPTVGSDTEYELPGDYIDVEAVLDNDLGIFIPEMEFRVSKNMLSPTGNGWYLYPQGYITFVTALADVGAKIFYAASWAKPLDDDEDLEIPMVASNAIIFFATSYCLLRGATGSANVRQYNTKVDAGAPTDNPVKDMSDYYMRRFEIELQRIPMKQKGIKF
jgi:hypothetical protein